MTAVAVHRPGSFCWIELSTNDAAAAQSFYSAVFGWSAVEEPGDHGTYTIFRKDGRDSAGMLEAKDVPVHWSSYVTVANVDQTIEKAARLGGSLVAGPFGVMDLGRMAFLTDPQGASFAVWEAKSHQGVGVRDEVNALCWNELHTRDLAAARAFYVALFGWRPKESDEYVEWHVEEQAVGGMLHSNAPADVPPFWLPYFSVADCDATVANAQSLGASVVRSPAEIPNVGRFAVLADPQGAVFAVICLAM